MKEAIKWTLNRMPKSDDKQLPIMSLSWPSWTAWPSTWGWRASM